MARKPAAGWHTYENVGELLSELRLTDEDMERAQQTTDGHIRSWRLARVRTEQDRTQEDPETARSATFYARG